MLSAVNQSSLTQQKARGKESFWEQKAENTKSELQLSFRNALFVSIFLSLKLPSSLENSIFSKG